MKRVYIIHGWDGYPTNHWFPWLKSKLEQAGFTVSTPTMPDPETPNRVAWTKTLQDLVPNPDKDTYFVGHSMGCQAVQRYLESLPEGKSIGGAVFVAGWLHLPHWEGRTPEELEVLKDWHDFPKDIEKMKQRCPKFVSIFSANDEFINEQNWADVRGELGGKIIVLENMNHFDKGVKELPEVFNALMEMSK